MINIVFVISIFTQKNIVLLAGRSFGYPTVSRIFGKKFSPTTCMNGSINTFLADIKKTSVRNLSLENTHQILVSSVKVLKIFSLMSLLTNRNICFFHLYWSSTCRRCYRANFDISLGHLKRTLSKISIYSFKNTSNISVHCLVSLKEAMINKIFMFSEFPIIILNSRLHKKKTFFKTS
jgi:hypothetical protein